MPYIRSGDRIKLDPLIDKLAKQVVTCAKTQGYDSSVSGLMNYTCTGLALQVIRLSFSEMRNWLIALVTGTFKNIADDFYRRVGIPCEVMQIGLNGDVDLYGEFAEEIKNISQ